MSNLGRHLTDYLTVRRALGFKLVGEGQLLAEFVACANAAGQRTITTRFALQWARRPTSGSRNYLSRRLRAVRGFARYLHALDPTCEIPPLELLPASKYRPAPYLYRDEEILALMTAAGGLRPPLRVATFQTLIGLLACTGLRIGEAIRLDREDFDCANRLLIVRDSKFGKSREVLLHGSTVDALVDYGDTRDRRSERAGTRVMASLTGFIQWRLRLRINAGKSAVAQPKDRHFLGFCLRIVQHGRRRTVEVGLSARTKRNAMARVRQLTPRTWGGTLESCIAPINVWLVGWHQFFGIASADEQQQMRRIDAHIRRRLRAIVLHHCKRQRTIARRLVALGVKPQHAWRAVYAGKKSTWALSHTPAVDHGLRNAYFAARGLVSVAALHRYQRPPITAPAHPTMAPEQG